ncbi:MAG TPA: outer membrane beta-barrel protein [Thermoanaerobaculia bacterium]|nr:outer membrane beta-barrel protein [Thermoanaerobaculia bacterium]
MRRLILTLTLFSLFSVSFTSLRAAENNAGRWRISVLAAEISSGNQPWSPDAHAGVSVGLSYEPTPQWDTEFTVATQSHRSPYTRFFIMPFPEGQPSPVVPVTEFRQYRVTPMDLSITRHFNAGQTIAPYVRAGARYVSAPDDPSQPSTFVITPGTPNPLQVHEGYGLKDRLSGEAGAGVRIRMTPRTALRVEATRLLRSDESDFDPLTRFAVGLNWMF